MNQFDQYFRRSQEIIGNRTESEEQYDNEVIKWLKKGMTIRKAINRANKRYPGEVLQLDETTVEDVGAHYEYPSCSIWRFSRRWVEQDEDESIDEDENALMSTPTTRCGRFR